MEVILLHPPTKDVPNGGGVGALSSINFDDGSNFHTNITKQTIACPVYSTILALGMLSALPIVTLRT